MVSKINYTFGGLRAVARAWAVWGAVVMGAGLTLPASAADFPGTLVLGRPTNQSIVANVLAPTAHSLYLEFGLQPGVYTGQTPPVALAANFPREVTIAGLVTNARYYYRIRFRAATATASHNAALFSGALIAGLHLIKLPLVA